MPSVKLITGTSTNFDFKPDIIIDGILGTGITGDIREPYASASILLIKLIVTNLQLMFPLEWILKQVKLLHYSLNVI